jgi:hypothetical protein
MREVGKRCLDVFRRQSSRDPIAIPHVGGMDGHREHKAWGIHEPMALPTLDLFRTVIAPFSTDPRRLDPVAVNAARTRLGLSPQNDSQAFMNLSH